MGMAMGDYQGSKLSDFSLISDFFTTPRTILEISVNLMGIFFVEVGPRGGFIGVKLFAITSQQFVRFQGLKFSEFSLISEFFVATTLATCICLYGESVNTTSRMTSRHP